MLAGPPAPPPPMTAATTALYLAMCLIWGLSWIAIKTGVDAVPPLFFAACRFLLAGVLLFVVARLRGSRVPQHAPWRRIVVAALLINTGCYATLFWGMQYVPSGFAGVVNLSLIPITLFVLGILFGYEHFTRLRTFALTLGVVGLLVLMRARLSIEPSPLAVAGSLAVIAATFSYSLGSVLSRPLLDSVPSLSLAAIHNLIGGTGLALLSLVFEEVDAEDVRRLVDPPVLASLAFLILCASLVAFTVFLRLLREWGPYRAGTYAFVSPIIAVGVGMGLAGERYTALEFFGAGLMLAAVVMSLRPARRSVPT
jgi:drug/metabolite transporter (DMT)-like permease